MYLITFEKVEGAIYKFIRGDELYSETVIQSNLSKTTGEIGTTWELRAATSVLMSI